MSKKRALITGVTGQDGSYLTELLLSKGYEVHGIKRRSSSINTFRIDHIYHDPHEQDVNFFLHYGDMTDSTSLIRIMQEVQPEEIYNLAAQSHVKVSFDCPEYTSSVNAMGTLRMLDGIKILGLEKKTRFYQASTSELYGKAVETPQNEKTPFYPRSPYAVAKLYAHWITTNYREAYDIFACNGILFNHESPVRGETFVTRKVTRSVSLMILGMQTKLYVGNLDAKRDWGHAKDYVEGMWRILQHKTPDDYVLATGETRTVKEFIELSFKRVGIELEWKGKGENEKGIVKNIAKNSRDIIIQITGHNNLTSEIKDNYLKKGDVIIEVDPRYFRPTEVDLLLGDASKARKVLGWSPTHKINDLVNDMVESDVRNAVKYFYLKTKGYQMFNFSDF